MRNFKSFRAADIRLPKTFLCFAGPNGSGKCVDGETEIFLADGTTAKIRGLVEEALAGGHVEEMDDGYIAQYDSPKEILSLDTKTLKVTKKRIAAFVKRKTPPKMLRVTTRSGREVVATEYHPFFVLEDGQIRPIRADQLKGNARIAIPRKLRIETKDTTLLEILDFVATQDSTYVPYDEGTARVIRGKKAGRTWQEIEAAAGVPARTLTSFIGLKQAMAAPHLVRVLKFLGLTELEIAHTVTHIKGRRNCPMRIPWQNSNGFCRFLGYLLAEGSISEANDQIRLTNGSDEVVSDFAMLAKELFGLEPHVYRYKKGAYDVVINCVALRDLLLTFGMSYDGAGGKSIPEVIMRHSTDEQLANLLSGLYSGDGYVSKNDVEITLKSEKLIHGIERILLRLGIVPRTARVTKRETKTGFTGTYLKITTSGSDNLRIFGENVEMAHPGKAERLGRLISKKSNPNVDLIEANSMIKKAAKDLGIAVKKSREEFPRLDAYCYGQCLPSRYGVRHLITNVFRPLAIQKSVQSETLARLETLSESDVFWDEIESIEEMEPREDWVYDLSISEHHNFIANGIFVHNSNLCDAIRFVMGEISLRSLRAKKVKDLIYSDSRSAEVAITFEGDGSDAGGYEIKRAIREDGKILYRLDGKKTTRSAILEALKKYNLDSSGRNTIAQGEVQRIIGMNGKERRVIIDSVAGITDFEDKKKEALSELGTVETRIKDANLVLGERRAFLGDLKNEKETALKYLDSKKTLTNAKGTLLKRELEKLEKELSDVGGNEGKLNAAKAAKEQEMAEVDARVKEAEAARSEISRQLQAKQKTNALIRQVEELRGRCSAAAQLIADREGQDRKVTAERETLEKELAGQQQDMDGLRKELDGLRSELKSAESRLGAHGGPAQDEAIARLRGAMERQDAELAQARERLITLASEISSGKQILDAKRAEEKGINVPSGSEEGAGSDAEGDRLRAEAAKIAGDIDASFARTKEINAAMGDLDREMLELKEKASIFKVRASPQLANPALSFIADLKAKEKGIYGTVADLITFDPKHANAVEAAGGARLLYVVVDLVDTATSVIERLKKARAGRATFIPLDAIRAPQAAKSGRAPSVIEVVGFPEEVRRAAEYVFAETLLVDTAADAKRMGVGTARLVTLDGEIFERSGVVSGGRSESGILGGNQLRKIEKELADVKARKDASLNELYSIREEESRMRARKSQAELRAKTLEMERRMADDRLRESAHLVKRKGQLAGEIEELEARLQKSAAEKEKLAAAAAEREKAAAALREQLRAAEEEFRKHAAESSRKMADLTGTVSSLRATIDGRTKELELRHRDCRGREERLKELQKDGKALIQAINESRRQLATDQKALTGLEGEISSASKEIERLFASMKEQEGLFAALGQQMGSRRLDVERLNRDLTQLTVKKATAETRLGDIRAEFAGYEGAQFLDARKDELTRMVGECETALAGMGNVNMAAIEMYDRKRQEIEEAEGRIARLDTERQAIMTMIAEIEEHKKEAFFETFQAVSDNFSGMFKHINIGDGHLYLDKPATPFESGLFIKIRKNNRDYSLDALSGGEKTLVALMFIFALQFFKPAPFYILDEVDAALDKPNSRNLSDLISRMTGDSQFIVVSHNDTVMSSADSVVGVAKVGTASRLVGVKLKQVAA